MKIEDANNRTVRSEGADSRQNEGQPEPQIDRQPQAPEPPLRYEPQENPLPPVNGALQPTMEFEAASRLVKAAQIMAFVSLIIGGVVLSTAAVVVAVIGYRKVTAARQSDQLAHDEPWRLMKRSATIAIAMAIGALVLNTIALAIIMPTVYEMLQTGDYASLWNETNPTSESNGSFWG